MQMIVELNEAEIIKKVTTTAATVEATKNVLNAERSYLNVNCDEHLRRYRGATLTLTLNYLLSTSTLS
jgi:hypothetical protein